MIKRSRLPADEEYEMKWPEIIRRVQEQAILFYLNRDIVPGMAKVFGIPRGGCAIAGMMGIPVDTPEEAQVIVDDIVDTGATRKRFAITHPNIPFIAIVNKDHAPDWELPWVVFPWEKSYTHGLN